MGKDTAMPMDSNKEVMQLIPAKDPIVSEITTLTTLLLDTETSLLELFNKDEDMVIKWGTGTINATNYSAIIPANQIRHLKVRDSQTNIMLAKLSDSLSVTKAYVLEF